MTSDTQPGTSQRRWSFRTRLTVTIAAIFVAAGIGLLGVQYLLVQGFFLLASGSTVCTSVLSTDAPGAAPSTSCVAMQGDVPFPNEMGPSGSIDRFTREGLEATLDEYSGELSEEVLGSLLVASVAVIAVFAVIAVLLASWLARRSLSRIAEVTALTRRITTDELDRRLELTGPDDEIKELGDTIDGMLDRLHTGFEAQDRFIQNASHELRTPLTVTRAALEIPLEQGRVPAELEPALRRALSANAHSERLIGALLVLARGRIRTPDRVRVDLGATLAAAVAEVEADAAARGVDVVLEASDSTAPDHDHDRDRHGRRRRRAAARPRRAQPARQCGAVQRRPRRRHREGRQVTTRVHRREHRPRTERRRGRGARRTLLSR